MKIYKYDVGHMTKSPFCPYTSTCMIKHLKNLLPQTRSPIFTKLVMLHRELKYIVVSSNDSNRLIMTYRTARSNHLQLIFLYGKM